MPRPLAEAVLALGATAGALAVQAARHRHALRAYEPPALPAFDAYVYVAMAEHPGVFTVAPWGHRVLGPWLASALPGNDLGLAFRTLTLLSLAAAALLLFAFLRRLGHHPALAALGAAAFLLSPPAGELVGVPYLVEPLSCALLVALMLALERGLALPALVLLGVLGVLAKEVVLLFLPLVFFARRGVDGGARAAVQAAAVTAAALAAALSLRLLWTPEMGTPLPDLGAGRWRTLAAGVAAEPVRWLAVLALGGLTPLAVVGAWRTRAGPYLGRYAWALAATLAQPLLAHYALHQVVGEMNRYLLYAVPVLVPLALSALDGVSPPATAASASRLPRWAGGLLLAAAAAAAIVPLAFVDPYRRLDLQGRRDGLYVLGFCKETLNTARKLDLGTPVLFKMEERRFRPQGFDPARLDRMRWFLREGWGPEPHYGTEEVAMAGSRATLVLPCYRPQPLELTLALAAEAPAEVRVSLNGRFLGRGTVEGERTRLRFTVPAEALFRGDNLLALEREAQAAPPRLLAVAYSPLAGP